MMKTAIKHKSRRFRRFLKANEAVSALEYAILVGVIAIGIGVAMATFSDNIKTALNKLGSDVAKTKITGSGGSITP